MDLSRWTARDNGLSPSRRISPWKWSGINTQARREADSLLALAEKVRQAAHARWKSRKTGRRDSTTNVIRYTPPGCDHRPARRARCPGALFMPGNMPLIRTRHHRHMLHLL